MVLAAALYVPVLASMAQEWWSQKNSSHGFLVPVIVAALVWQQRQVVRSLSRIWAPGLVFLGFGFILYPLGLISGVEFLPRVSFVVALGGLMLYLLGPQASRVLAFPYAFVWFMVPWPDTLVEFVSFPMQLFSAKFAGMLVGLVGVPVSRDGVYIHLPSYTFSVGVPCSGMRSLVALLALSALVAHVMVGPNSRRWGLFVAGLPLAMLANVARISVILGIATIWGSKVAEGFFHGFSGVIVFLFATIGLLATGKALGLHAHPDGSETRSLAVDSRENVSILAPTRRLTGWATSAGPLILVGITGAMVVGWRLTEPPPAHIRMSFAQVPMSLPGWQGADLGPLDRVSEEMLRPDAFMNRTYSHNGFPVNVTVVFGHAKDTFHSPGMCLLGGGWNITHKGRREVSSGDGRDVLANQFDLQRQDARRVVLYWYASPGETTPSLGDLPIQVAAQPRGFTPHNGGTGPHQRTRW